MNCALYSRVSTDKQECENQLSELRAFAARQGWTVTAEYVDRGVSGAAKVRPAFDKMMVAASRKEFDLLLFWRLDRLSREGVRRTLAILTQLDNWNVAWRSYSESHFDSCGLFKDAVLASCATLAQQERIAISERTKAGLKRAVKAGRTLGRRPVDVDVKAAKRMQREGMGLRGIAAELGISVNTLRNALAQNG